MNEKLLKEYVQEVMREGGSWGGLSSLLGTDKRKGEEAVKKIKDVWKKIKSFVDPNAAADDVAEAWMEQQELYYDIDFPDETQEKIKQYTRVKLPRIVDRARGDVEKAKRSMSRALEIKFSPEVRTMKKALQDREKEEDWDIDK